MVLALAGGGCIATPDGTGPTVLQARAELRALLEDVEGATASRFDLTDDRGHGMGTAEIIWAPEADAFAAVSFDWSEATQAFRVNLATSTNLLTWSWQTELATLASQPSIARSSDGGYVVAWEQEPDPIHNVIARYATWDDLLAGREAQRFDVPITTPACGEGTPSILSASSERVDMSFHYHRDCDFDREAAGWTDWDSWTASTRPEIDAALEEQGVRGHIGDRDTITFDGHELMLVEGQLVHEAFESWRIFLYDEATGDAEQIRFRTPGGSQGFSNPTATVVQVEGADALLVTLFVGGEVAGANEAGGLLYYTLLGN
jgi:hypothetical protein